MNIKLIFFYLIFCFLFLQAEIILAQDTQLQSPRENISLGDTSAAEKYYDNAWDYVDEARYDSAEFYFRKSKKIYQRLMDLSENKEVWSGKTAESLLL
ncbi:MAG: hypothetical protein WCE54_15945 [Ignavibacteriaceae bacterium]